jgi:hypothetical protein
LIFSLATLHAVKEKEINIQLAFRGKSPSKAPASAAEDALLKAFPV